MLAAALLSLVAGLAFAPAFGGHLDVPDFAPGRLLVALVAAVLAPTTAVAVCTWRQWSAALAAISGLIALAVAIGVGARPGSDVVNGPYRLLTTALPADAEGPALAAVAAVVGVTALISTLAVGYSRAALLAVLAPLGCLVLALALDAGVHEPPAWYVVAVVAAVGLTVAALGGRTVTDDSARGLRKALPTVTTVAAIGAAAVLASLLTPSVPGVRARPADVRALVPAPLVPRTGISPLQQFVALHNDSLGSPVKLSGTSSERLQLLRLVTLDAFDGSYWTTQARYRRAGHSLAASTPAHTVRVDVRASNAPPLAWLLQPGSPVSLDATDMGVDEKTGDLAVPAGQDFPLSYRVVGHPAPTAQDPSLVDDTPVALSGPVDTSDEPVPDDIAAFARRARTASTGSKQLETLLRQLRSPGFYLDDRPDAPGGHGFFQISALLAGSGGTHAATSEQYASAFAVMARVLGFDARVVLGFRPVYSSGDAFTVSGSGVYAWAEVHFARAGWVTFEPTPTALASLSRRTAAPTTAPPKPKSSSTPSPSARPSSARASKHAGTAKNAAGAAATRSARTLWLTALLVALVLVVFSPPALKAGRRRRRRSRPPARAVYGAWQETLDRFLESGTRMPSGMTAGEVAGAAPETARLYVTALAQLLDRAGYAPEPADIGLPRIAWTNAAAVGTALRSGRPPLKRLLAWLDPRPLWRR